MGPRFPKRLRMSGYRFDRLKVLVVDDNVHMCKVVCAILHGFGVQHVCEAHDAEQAWTMSCDFKPDIIVLDWMMPGMTGIELAQKIRTDEASPDPYVPIIMLTGYTSIARVREARDAGVTEVLAKPVSAQAIYSRLASIAERPRPFVRTKMFFGPDRRRHEDEYKGPERRDDDDETAKVA